MLAGIAGLYARRLGSGVRFMHDDGFWFRRLDDRSFICDGRSFRYFAIDMIGYDQLLSGVRHAWLPDYVPGPGDTVVDVGAGSGTDTLVFSRLVGDGGKVIAIEAQPSTFDLLKRTCSVSRLTNVTCVNTAVADRRGTARIECGPIANGNRLVQPGENGESVEVSADSLDAILEPLASGRIDYLKMNIEGAERLALDGMSRTLSRTSHIMVSCHDFIASATGNDWYRTRDLVADRLRAAGFTLTFRDDPEEAIRDQVSGRASTVLAPTRPEEPRPSARL
jgi:FkbM family methyltransferase